METHIGLSNGGKFDFATAGPDDVNLATTAHALSKIVRYTGHCNGDYSVAQHSVYVARRLVMMGYPQYALYGVLHDSPESVYGDPSSPFKTYMNDRTQGLYGYLLKEIDHQFLHAFADDLRNFCHYTEDCLKKCKRADLDLFFLERDKLMPQALHLYADAVDPSLHPGGDIRDIDPNFEPWSSRRAEHVFIKEYEQICAGKHTDPTRRFG